MTQNEGIEKKETNVVKTRRRKGALAGLTVLFALVVIASMQLFRRWEGHRELQRQRQQQAKEFFADEAALTLQQEEIEEDPALTAKQQLEERVEMQIAQMSLADKVAGLFVVTPESLTGVSHAVRAGEATSAALQQYPVGGVVYFAKNMQSTAQLTEMIAQTRQVAKYPLFIAVDEEGGSVSRVADAGLAPKSDTAKTIGETSDPHVAYEVGDTIGGYLSELGFDLDFAPVADIRSVENSAIGSRSYGTDAETVAEFVVQMMNGLQQHDVTACLKHFPGVGGTTQDTHDGLAFTERTKEQFYAEDFQVFASGIASGAKMIMVGHVSAPYLTMDRIPCCMSSAVVTDLLRNELSFEGVIITDAMNMGAISTYYSSQEAAIQAIKAGCDMILMPESFQQAYQGVFKAVQDGVISLERIDDSLRRIYRIKYAQGNEES